MKIKILYFATAREAAAGLTEEIVELEDEAGTTELLARLLALHPALSSVMKSCILALNQEYVLKEDSRTLQDGDEIALIPPISGG